MLFRSTATRALALLLVAGPILAQDSVSKTPCLPGDGTSPWDDSAGPFGSEQCDEYVVNMAPFISSWGNTFGAAPILKSSKTQGQFFGSLMNGNGLSRLQALGVPYPSTTYSQWVTSPGSGVNNDPAISDPGTPVDKTGALGHQFAAAFGEFSTPAASYNGIVSAAVNLDPTDPTRLFVSRRVAATNGCDGNSDFGQFGFGSIDENGELVFRSDDFGSTGGTTCGPLTVLNLNNVLRVDSLARDCSSRNVISFEALTGGGQADAGAIGTVVPLYGNTLNAPGIVPGSVTGGTPLYIGTDFGSNFVRGTSPADIKVDQTHFASGVTDHRGNITWSPYNFPLVAGTHGTCAILGKDTNDLTRVINLFGIDDTGVVTGTAGVSLPGTLMTDPTTGFTPTGLPGDHEFGHYFSQVAFRGGNGQIALGRDQQGRLLAAAAVDYPAAGGGSHNQHYLAVARVDPTTGAEEWVIAAYNAPAGGGKPILNGPGGAAIGRINTLMQNPSIGVPMIDSVGNLYFVAAVETFTPPDTGVGLVRAVYDPVNFDYELELLFDSGTVLTGINSGRNYMITWVELDDSNSLSSASPFSQNIASGAHLSNRCPSTLAPSDPRTLGGLVMAVEITYDYEPDADFDPCSSTTPADPLTQDPDYNVLLYVGATDPGADLDGNGVADEAEFLAGDKVAVSLSAGGTTNFDLQAGLDFSGQLYFFLGSVTGTGPGPFGIPLTFDFYTNLRIANPGLLFTSGLGLLDAQGKVSDAFIIPPGLDPSLAGKTAYHAYVLFKPPFFGVPGGITGISNPWPTLLNP